MATPALQSEPRAEAFDGGLDSTCDGRNDARAVTLEQYLNTAYNPDCDYIDGYLQERNLGDFDHGDVQTQIAYIFRANAAAWQVKAIVEVRLQVKATRFRLPDVMVLHPGQQRSHVIMVQAPMSEPQRRLISLG
jgi:hypothetical protein